MTKKTTKVDEKTEVVTDEEVKLMTEEAGVDKAAQEMAKTIRKMYDDRDAKAMSAKERLVSQLEVTADKYRTANGVMSALETVRIVIGDNANMTLVDSVATAKSMAMKMAVMALDMAEKAKGLDPEEFETLCDGFYDTDFAAGDGSVADMIEQLLALQLCQNVGPNAADVTEFCTRSDEEIEKARKDLREFCEKNDLDYLRVCSEA